MGRVHLFEVEKPQVVLEVAGRHVESEVLANYRENPNFTELVQHVTVVREGTERVLCVVRSRHRACPTCDSGESRRRGCHTCDSGESRHRACPTCNSGEEQAQGVSCV